MFSDNNLILLLLCLFPVILYSLIIFANSPSFSIKLKTTFIYLYTGFLSVTLLQFIHFVFPHMHDLFLQKYIGDFDISTNTFIMYKSTIGTVLLFAFFQVALMEEFSKWLALKCVDYMRGKRKKNLDHPYAIMFYSCLIGASFSIVENVQYAQRAMVGEFGPITAESMLAVRAVTSVVIHMACGLIMGYYVARAKGESRIKKYIYNAYGLLSATFVHGIYDFNLMKENDASDFFNLFGVQMHTASVIIILVSLVSCFLMASNLKAIRHNQEEQLHSDNTTAL